MVRITDLDNGVRVITESVEHVRSVALGIWIAAGSKLEQPHEFGISHLLEHMLFKGTLRRSARDIAEEMAAVGGQLNAATDREYTTFYARVLKDDVALAMDILGDMLLNSLMDAEELRREQDVVADEIHRHEDAPEDRVHDFLAELAWDGHALAHSVLGTEETVRSATPEALRAYLKTHYTPDRTVVAAAGALEHEQVVDLAAKSLEPMTGRAPDPALPPLEHRPGRAILDRDTEAVYFCLGAPAYCETDDRKYPLAILDSVLGGGMSSRLFQEIREKRGLAYDIGSYRLSYHEGGMLTVYGGTGAATLREVLSLVRAEIESLRAGPPDPREMARAHAQIRAGLLMAQESMGTRMTRLGKCLLDYGRFIPVEEVVARLDAVTENDVLNVAQEVLRPGALTLAVVGPEEEVTEEVVL